MKAKLGVKHKIPGPGDKNESESDKQKSWTKQNLGVKHEIPGPSESESDIWHDWNKRDRQKPIKNKT